MKDYEKEKLNNNKIITDKDRIIKDLEKKIKNNEVIISDKDKKIKDLEKEIQNKINDLQNNFKRYIQQVIDEKMNQLNYN